MSPMEQAAYFWSFVVMENADNRFTEYGIEFPFVEDYLQSFALPHSDDMLVRRIKEVNPDWKRQYVQKRKDAKNGRYFYHMRYHVVPWFSSSVCLQYVVLNSSSRFGIYILCRHLSSFGIFIPKLFSKHLKMDEQVGKRNRVNNRRKHCSGIHQ